MTAVGTISGRHCAVASQAGSFGSSGTNQPPVPGEIRRGVGHFGLVVIPGTHITRVVGAIILVAAKELPGEARTFKLI